MRVSRRFFLAGLAALVALASPAAWANPGLHRHPHGPKRRRRIRRRVRRRRIRRRVGWRVVAGRRRLIVPLAIAIGWELALDDRIVVVREVHEKTIVVVATDGSSETIDVVREDTAENGEDQVGSEYEVEIEEEVDEGVE